MYLLFCNDWAVRFLDGKCAEEFFFSNIARDKWRNKSFLLRWFWMPITYFLGDVFFWGSSWPVLMGSMDKCSLSNLDGFSLRRRVRVCEFGF